MSSKRPHVSKYQIASSDEYAAIEETIEEDVMRAMLNWLDNQHKYLNCALDTFTRHLS